MRVLLIPRHIALMSEEALPYQDLNSLPGRSRQTGAGGHSLSE